MDCIIKEVTWGVGDMGIGKWISVAGKSLEKVGKHVEAVAKKRRAREAEIKDAQKRAELEKAIADAKAQNLAKRENAAARRSKLRTADGKELPSSNTAKTSVAKAKKSAGSTTTVKAHDRKGSEGVKTHQRSMTAAEKRIATAAELLKGDQSVTPSFRAELVRVQAIGFKQDREQSRTGLDNG